MTAETPTRSAPPRRRRPPRRRSDSGHTDTASTAQRSQAEASPPRARALLIDEGVGDDGSTARAQAKHCRSAEPVKHPWTRVRASPAQGPRVPFVDETDSLPP